MDTKYEVIANAIVRQDEEGDRDAIEFLDEVAISEAGVSLAVCAFKLEIIECDSYICQIFSQGHGRPSLLHLAAARDRESVIIALMAKGAEIDAKDESGYTALHLACWHGQKAAAVLLASFGADPAAEGIDVSLFILTGLDGP